MIGYWGYKGSGKTLSCVSDIYQKWVDNPNLVIFSNTPLIFGKHPKTNKELDYYRYSDSSDLVNIFNFALMYGDRMLKKETIIFIDEASVIFNARHWKDVDPGMLAFIFQSRHINVDIWYTTQHPLMVDTNFRRITESWFHVQKVSFLAWTLFQKLTEQELSPEGTLIEEKSSDVRLFFRKHYGKYLTVGLDSMIGLGSNLKSLVKDFPPQLESWCQLTYPE